MSIRGIDTQIMITRSSDFVRETSSTQRQPETTQEHLALQGKVDSVLDQSRVAATLESEMENVRTDVDGEGSGAAGEEGSKRDKEEQDEDLQPELLVPPSTLTHFIDITI